jgi:hypothetical protein
MCERILSLALIVVLLVSCSTSEVIELEDHQEESESTVLADSGIDEKTLESFQVAPVAAPTAPVETKLPTGKNIGSPLIPKVSKKKPIVAKKLPSVAAEWVEQDQKSQGIWSKFSIAFLPTTEEHKMQVSYLGVVAATSVLTVMPMAQIQGRPVYHFRTRAKTSDFYKWVYSLDDVLDSYVDKEHFTPLKYVLKQVEKNKTIDDVQLFDRAKHMTYFRYKKVKDGVESKDSKDVAIPFYNQDYLSSFFFLRGLPLQNGDQYLFPVTTKGSTWLMSVKVAKREEIVINLGKFKAIRLEVISKYTSELAKQNTMIFWLSDDEKRIFLRTNAEVKFGALKSELTSYSQNGKVLLGKP